MTGTIVQLSCSRGGVPKHAVAEADVTWLGLAGDWQRNRRLHGGPDRALCLFAIEIIERLQAEGHPIAPGSTGENVTIRGLDWRALGPGVELALGDRVRIAITQLTTPCKTIKRSFADGKFLRLGPPEASRMYARVLVEGRVRVGDRVVVG
ncbi:MAG TPA: MOSC domain-containing protein [Kofleriaceae bacterium]|nr:MOSC domain-containing protein [Kofleriaceae bacterium]